MVKSNESQHPVSEGVSTMRGQGATSDMHFLGSGYKLGVHFGHTLLCDIRGPTNVYGRQNCTSASYTLAK